MGKKFVSLLATAGGGFNTLYLFQGRNAIRPDFQRGEYPFIWPGALGIFGGAIEEGETPKEGILREMNEELHITLTPEQISQAELREYLWKRDAERIYEKANNFFHGNLPNFFGPSLESIVPSSALGNDRSEFMSKYGNSGTRMDWLKGRTDYYLAVDFKDILDLTTYEGVGAVWLPHWAARATVGAPCDKLAILDDMVKKVEAGKLAIEPTS